MRSVVPRHLFNGDVMPPDFGVLPPAGSGLELWLFRLEAYSVEEIVAIVVVNVITLAVLDVTLVGSRRNNRVRAPLHRERRFHTIWVGWWRTVTVGITCLSNLSKL